MSSLLQSQETVNFCALHVGLPVSTGSVQTSLIPCQNHPRELAQHSPFGSKKILEAGMIAGRVGVGRCLPGGAAGTAYVDLLDDIINTVTLQPHHLHLLLAVLQPAQFGLCLGSCLNSFLF